MQEHKDYQANYATYYRNHKLQKKHVLYEAYGGRGMVCNPYGIFKAFMERKDFSQYEHYWVIEDFEDNQKIMEKYGLHKNVHFVQYQSDDYVYHVATAKYLINNVSFPAFYTPRKGQIYFNTWHGLPLKKIGFDVPDGNVGNRNGIRNFLAADYLLSPNDFMTEIYKKAFKLEDLYTGKVIQEGQPRNDVIFQRKQEGIYRKIQENGVCINPNKKLILYAPTWKGRNYYRPDINIEEYVQVIQSIEANLNTNEYQILVKPHQIVYKYLKDEGVMTDRFVPATIDASEILSVTDILISDYSSIFFDFITTGRPIIFFDPDIEQYEKYRGIYHGTDKLPGPVVKTVDEIIASIRKIENNADVYKIYYDDHKKWSGIYEDGHCGERILQILLDGKNKEKLVSVKNHLKTNILIYGSDLRGNGVTQSLLSLLEQIDYEAYDVTLLTVLNHEGTNRNIICDVDERVRVITQFGSANGTEEEKEAYDQVLKEGLKGHILKRNFPKKYLQREFMRTFGKSRFDCVIEFTGYSPHYGLLFLASGAKQKFIWQHNDLGSECKRAIQGGALVGTVLKTIFSFYPFFDKIVSCSEAVMKLNKENLATVRTKGKFTFVRNTFSVSRIKKATESNPYVTISGKEYYVLEDKRVSFDEQRRMELLEMAGKDDMVYASMGRLSPEKNQTNLIRAFEELHKQYKNTKLYILGDGPLRKKLEIQIQKAGLEGNVILTGNMKDPFAFLKKCDCFVLPSKYEGQPMSVLEMRVLGVPIILSDFATGKDVCIPNGQIIVKKDADSIRDGMEKVYRGKAPVYSFDAQQYNRCAYAEFERLLKGRMS